MASQLPNVLLLLFTAACALASCPSASGQQLIESVADLQRAIYTEMRMMSNIERGGDACVRLLTATGTVGCAAPQATVEGRLVHLEELLPSPGDYPDDSAFLLAPALLADFLDQCLSSPELLGRVRGILVEGGPPPGYSQAPATPLSDFALYPNKSYAWNPAGRGLSLMDLPFPIFQLDEATAANAVQRAANNRERNMNGALHRARMTLAMDAAHNSSACLSAGTCLPLGGHSVVAALPPLPPSSSSPTGSDAASSPAGGGDSDDDGMPGVWILSQFDSAALFHEATVGADAPVSGLIAMLAAAKLLGGYTNSNASAAAGQAGRAAPYRRRLVFAALGGEPWGLMGSKRLLWEVHRGNSSVAGLSLAPRRIAGVLEVTQVGRARQPGSSAGVRLFTHTPRSSGASSGGSSGDPSAELLEALRAAAEASAAQVPGGVAVGGASEATPGLPPTASAGSFVRVVDGDAGGRSLPAALLSGFDAAFEGPTFQTQYDSLESVDPDSIAAAAVVLARAAHRLALGGEPGGGPAGASGAAAAGELPVDYGMVKAEVQALMQCLLNASVGLNCPLAAAVMTPVRGGHVAHYIGILRTITADPQTPDGMVKSDTERFIWNYLAFATAAGGAQPPSGSDAVGGGSSSSGNGQGGGGGLPGLQRCQPMNATSCPPGLVCAGSRSIRGKKGLGVCLNATVRYVPSYSTSLDCQGCDGVSTLYDLRWKLTDAAAEWERQYGWLPDPLWTESNWPRGTPALTLYLREAPGVEEALLAAGLAVAAASGLGAVALRAAYHRKLKRQ